jgi:hypothetical protein
MGSPVPIVGSRALVTTCTASAMVRRPASASPGTARASPVHSAVSDSLPSSSAMMLSDTARLSALSASSASHQ